MRQVVAVLLAGVGLITLVNFFSAVAQQASPRTVPPNTWVNLQAGGIAAGTGVGDEGYSTFVYSPGLGRALVYGKYHARELSWGEDQNALLVYDFAANRWDVLEIGEAAWSEFLPGIGHDQGNVAVDPRRDLYITHGNMTLHGNTAYQTYVFDLKAGRGKRMLPAAEGGLGAEVASAFDPNRGVMLTTNGPSRLYNPDTNVWTQVPNPPSRRPAPGLVFDSKHDLFVMFGGVISGSGFSSETWTFDTATQLWRKRTPAVAPPARKAPNMAFDSLNGITLLVGGRGPGEIPLTDMWIYDLGRDHWTPLPITAPAGTSGSAGNNLVYDSRNRVFLLKDVVVIRNLWAFRYQP
jgi:hypothetical protein